MLILAAETKKGSTNLFLFTALVFIKSASLYPLPALRLLMQAVKAIPFHSLDAEVKHKRIPSLSIAGQFAVSIPITFTISFL